MNGLGVALALLPLVGGVLVVVFRVRLAAWNARITSRTFGEYGKRTAQNSTSTWVLIVGIGLILLGVVGLLRVLFPGSS